MGWFLVNDASKISNEEEQQSSDRQFHFSEDTNVFRSGKEKQTNK